MAQTYCTRADIESIVGQPGVLACIDDDRDGAEVAGETAHVTNAIERAAVEMNAALSNQYPTLSSLASNAWCKWCNAYLAAYMLYARRGNPPPHIVIEAVGDYREKLAEARWGRFQIPEQLPENETIATVSNFQPELHRRTGPISVDVEQSTGASPQGGRKRNVADMPGY